jgi:hypothetical protein
LVRRSESAGGGTRRTADYRTRERRTDQRTGDSTAGSTDPGATQGAITSRMAAGAETKKASKGHGESA